MFLLRYWQCHPIYVLFATDFVLTFEKVVKETKKLTAEELSERQLKRENKRNAFLATLEKAGIEHEIEIPKVNYYSQLVNEMIDLSLSVITE